MLLRNGHLEADAAVYAGLAAAGFTEIQPGHGVVLRNLGEDGARPSEIAIKAQISRQAIAKVVDDLERLGFVRRVPDPADGRGVIVRFTDRGLAGLAVARQAMRDLEAEYATRVGPARWREVRSVLDTLFGD